MEFKRDSVIYLYLAGKPQVAFVRALQHLNVNTFFVSRSVARRQGSGRKKTTTLAWAAITSDGIRINAEYYRENILEVVLNPWARNILSADLGHSNRTQHAPHKNGYKIRFLA